MIPARFEPLVFAFFMSALMAFVMSGVLTLVNVGPVEGFFRLWMRAYLAAWIVAMPTTMLVAPLVRRLTKLTVRVA